MRIICFDDGRRTAIDTSIADQFSGSQASKLMFDLVEVLIERAKRQMFAATA